MESRLCATRSPSPLLRSAHNGESRAGDRRLLPIPDSTIGGRAAQRVSDEDFVLGGLAAVRTDPGRRCPSESPRDIRAGVRPQPMAAAVEIRGARASIVPRARGSPVLPPLGVLAVRPTVARGVTGHGSRTGGAGPRHAVSRRSRMQTVMASPVSDSTVMRRRRCFPATATLRL